MDQHSWKRNEEYGGDSLAENKIKKEARNNVIKKFDVEKMCFSTYSEYKKLFNDC